MPYKFKPNRMYRMPTHFGPTTGPRQGEGGRKFANVDSPKVTRRSVSFLTNRDHLEELLPEGLELGTEPVVTVSYSIITEIEWLAGRGYNTLGVSFPAVFEGEENSVSGSFLTVLWENLADPIITGREELGFSKIYCELPEPRVHRGTTHCTASWMGFKFMDMKIRDRVPRQAEERRDPALQVLPEDRGMGDARGLPLHAHPLRGLERDREGDVEGRGLRAVSRGHMGGPTDALLHRQRVTRPGDKGVPGGHDGQDSRREGPQRPAHPPMTHTPEELAG
jgi:hypothetical protein